MTGTKSLGRAYENRIVVILTTGAAAAAIHVVVFNFLSSFIASDLHLSNGQIGIISGSGMAMMSLGVILCALVSDHLGRRRIFLVTGLLLLGVLSMVTSLAGSFTALLVLRMAIGLCEGPIIPMNAAIMNVASSPSRRGVNLGIVQTFGDFGVVGVAGPIILVAIATHFGWRLAFTIVAVPALIMAITIQFTIKDVTVKASDDARVPLLSAIGMVLVQRNIQLCFLIGSCAIGWLGTITAFLPLWLIRHFHFAPSAMGIMMSCLGAAGAVSSFLVPGLSDRIGRRSALVIFALIGVIVPLGMLFGPPNLFVLGAAIFIGCLFTGIFPIFISIIPLESVDARHGATALAIVLGCAQLAGSLLGPVLDGALADRFSLAAPFYGSIVFAISAALLGLFLLETAPKRRHEGTSNIPAQGSETRNFQT